MDWPFPIGNTPWYWLLPEINRELSTWIEGTLGIKTHRMPYWLAAGGTYLKNKAALADLAAFVGAISWLRQSLVPGCVSKPCCWKRN
jgi:hypothetical protein